MANWFDSVKAAIAAAPQAAGVTPPTTTMGDFHQVAITPERQQQLDRARSILAQHPGGFFSGIGNKLVDMAQSGQLQQLATPQGRIAAYQARFAQNPNDFMSRIGNAAINYAQQRFPQQMPGQAQPIQTPTLPSQQSQTPVLMQAPDGTMQHVDPAHVDHYTGLGAQVINGSSYGGGGY